MPSPIPLDDEFELAPGASAAMQDYLAEAYRIAYDQGANGHISTSALAAALGVTAAAVTRMVKRLKDAGYLDHERYRGVRLTPEGERAALNSIRRHRIVERFLTDVLGFGWDEVHIQADALGGVVSDAVVERMAVMAGSPTRCPHGEPIPTPDGVMPPLHDTPLADVPLGHYQVSRARTHDAAMLRYLGGIGLHPGQTFALLERAPFNGPLKLHTPERGEVFIGDDLARALHVTPC